MGTNVRSLLGRVGVWSMELHDAGRPQVKDAAGELDALGLRALWIPGLDGHGVFDDVGHLLGSAANSAVVVGVLGIWGQDPTAIGDRLHQLDAEFGPRTIIGFGVSNEQSAVNAGQVYGNPIAAVGVFLDRLDEAAHPVRPERRLLGANGPKMAQLAAFRTAGLHPFLVTPRYSATTRGPDRRRTLHCSLSGSGFPRPTPPGLEPSPGPVSARSSVLRPISTTCADSASATPISCRVVVTGSSTRSSPGAPPRTSGRASRPTSTREPTTWRSTSWAPRTATRDGSGGNWPDWCQHWPDVTACPTRADQN